MRLSTLRQHSTVKRLLFILSALLHISLLTQLNVHVLANIKHISCVINYTLCSLRVVLSADLGDGQLSLCYQPDSNYHIYEAT